MMQVGIFNGCFPCEVPIIIERLDAAGAPQAFEFLNGELRSLGV